MKFHTLIVWGIVLSTLSFSVVWAVTFSGFVYPDSGVDSKKMNITLKLGDAWVDPYIGHLGEDFIGDPGESIYAIADGVVKIVKDWPNCPKSLNHGWGPVLIIEHELEGENVFETKDTFITDNTQVNPKKVYSQYGHIQNILVKEEESVKKGQKIGEIGHVCNYSLDHLHFELKDEQGFNDDLFNGAGRGYSGVAQYAPHRYSPSKFIELNKNLIVGETELENIDIFSEPKQSWWQKTKNFFGNLFDREDVRQDVEGEKIEEKSEEKHEVVYDADIINEREEFDVLPDQEIEIKVRVKNIGTIDWARSDVSLNITTPTEQNKQFKHSSWLTSLRPALLDQSYVGNDQEGTFSFFIKTPDEVGEYVFQALIVKTGEWVQIGNEIFTAHINVLHDTDDDVAVEEALVGEALEPPKNGIEKDSGKKILDNIKDVVKTVKEKTEDVIENVVDVVKNIPTYFGGGGGGSSTPASDVEDVEEEVIVDVTSPTQPTVVINLSESATSTLYMSWQSSDDQSDIIYYDVEYRVGENEWSQILTHVTTTEYMYEIINHGNHNIRVRAFDEVENSSDWSISEVDIVTDWLKDIVINEVAWMGIAREEGCDYDEWVELYNPGETDISLDGWAFEVAYDDYGYTAVLQGNIEAGGYYLIGKYEDVILNKKSDSVFVEGTDFLDTGARLVLWNSELEKVDETDQSAGWFAGSMDETYRTMERIDPIVSGNNVENWKTNESIRYDVRSYCGQVYGSPGQDNDHNWYLNDIADNYIFNASSTLVLSSEHSPYIFGHDVTVPENYTVSIDPGVTLLGVDKNSSFIVEGLIDAKGDENNRIVFTSIHDINNDVESQPGDWQNIIIKNSGVFEGSFVDFFYGGNTYRYDSCTTCGANQVIRNEGGNINLKNILFENIFIDEEIGNDDAYVWSSGGELILYDSIFSGGQRGLVTQSNVDISAVGLTFLGFSSSTYPVELGNSMPVVWKDNTFTSNTLNMARISVTELEEDYTIENGSNFLFTNLNVSLSTTLTIKPGARLYLSSYGMLNVYGSLDVVGMIDNPVYITSPGRFGGIYFSSATGNLSHVNISNGGSFRNRSTFPMHSMSSAMVWSKNSEVLFDSCSIMESRRPGDTVRIEGGNTVFRDCILGWKNPYDKTYLSWEDNGIWTKYSTLHLDNVTFKRMNYAVQMYKDYQFTYENMRHSNFENMFYSLNAKKWFPSDLFSSL